jgi:hypothetical protein
LVFVGLSARRALIYCLPSAIELPLVRARVLDFFATMDLSPSPQQPQQPQQGYGCCECIAIVVVVVL